MFEEFLQQALQHHELVAGEVSSRPLRYTIEDDGIGCCRAAFTMNTRHYLTSVPLNERLSHRHDLSWLVISASTSKLLSVITQSEASYQHPDLYVELPFDKEVILVPSAPYIINAHPVISSTVHSTGYRTHTFRYEIQVGASSDAGFIGDRWSYREGRLCFGNWYNNKPFRWSLDQAEIILPTIPGAPCCIRLDLHAFTDFDVLIDDQVVGRFNQSGNGVRWHDEGRRIDVHESLIKGETITLVFRFRGETHKNIEFNLRQEGISLSRITVDFFDKKDALLPLRVAQLAWNHVRDRSGEACYDFVKQVFNHKSTADVTPQTVIALNPIEFDLLDCYFSPHEQLWLSTKGTWLALLRLGISACVRPLGDLGASKGSDSIIIAPLRYSNSSCSAATAELVKGSWPDHRRGILLSPTTGSLNLAGLKVNDDLPGAFAYRELFEAEITPGRGSNFWEFIVTLPDYWETHNLAIHENVLIGKPRSSPALLLASASAEDWIETGDPDAGIVLDRFCSLVAGAAPAKVKHLPCAVAFDGHGALLGAYDTRIFADSGGCGIARGWTPIHDSHSSMPPIPCTVARNEGGPSSFTTFARLLSHQALEGASITLTGGICSSSVAMSGASGGIP